MSETRLWYAVYTRSRHEKVVAEELWQRKIEVFLPLRSVISKWKDRRKEVQFPLFPGYIFVRTDVREHRLDILKVPSVVRIIGFNNEPAPIPAEQVDAVKTLVFSKLPYDPFPEMVVGTAPRSGRVSHRKEEPLSLRHHGRSDPTGGLL